MQISRKPETKLAIEFDAIENHLSIRYFFGKIPKQLIQLR